ncbi:hypothetical protein Pla52n_03790 [Stieleria varia]|uniref:Uncharacterized protein n=1 Tax=Stieleria varia TaxID=2528005 RepID=A0A5C6BBA5_9BACT|nr:hypothetical protein Pla52n_03790 [Stieleria varia]
MGKLCNLKRSLDSAQTEVLAIEHFVLDEEKAASFSAAIFRIAELPAEVFVTEEFVERAFAFQLNGFDFVKAWPVEPGVIWRQNSLRTNSDRKRPAIPGGTVSNYVINAREPLDEELLSQLNESIAEGASFIRCAKSDRPMDIVVRIEGWLVENRSTLTLNNETDEEERDAIVTMLGALYGKQFCESFGWTWSIVDRSDIEGSTLAIQDPSGDYGIFPLLHLEQLFVHPSSSPKLQLCFDMVQMNSYAQHVTRNTNGSFVDLIGALHAIVPPDDGK